MKKGFIENFRQIEECKSDRFDGRFTSSYKHSVCFSSSYASNPIGFEFPTIEIKDEINTGLLKLIIGGLNLTLPRALQEIYDEIEFSKYILTLEPNWDNSNGNVISPNIYLGGINFLSIYANYLHKEGYFLESPQIEPCADGTLDLSWRTDKARLLVNIRTTDEGGLIAKFYGDLRTNLTGRSGFLNIKDIDVSFAQWLKHLCK